MLRVAAIIAALCSCSAPPIDTRLGNPDVVIRGVSPEAASDALCSRMRERGYAVESRSDRHIVFWRRPAEQSSVTSLGSPPDVLPAGRVICSVSRVDGGTRIFAAVYNVQGPALSDKSRRSPQARAMHELLLSIEPP